MSYACSFVGGCTAFFCEVLSRRVVVAISEETLTFAAFLQEVFYGDYFSENGELGFQALLHCAHEYFAQAFRLDGLAFAVFAFQKHYLVHSDFSRFFKKPFHTVGVFGRGHGKAYPASPMFPNAFPV